MFWFNLIVRLVLMTQLSGGSALFGQALAVTTPAAVTLGAGTSPDTGQVGVTTLYLAGNGFPSGAISNDQVVVALQKISPTAPSVTAIVTGVTSLPGSGRRIAFQLAGTPPTAPAAYRVSVSGSTQTGESFASTNTAALTVNPPAEILSIVPASAQAGQTVSVNIGTRYTNFMTGSTVASLGDGISVSSLMITSRTEATARIVIAANAAAGPRPVALRTGLQVATSPAGFRVEPTNRAPVVNAGPDRSITPPNAAMLTGTVTDDGLPAGAAVTSSWTKQSGPGTVTFANPNSASTTATFSQAGTYVLRLTATDTALSAFDEVTITVNAGNVAPTVNAGPNQTISLPGTASLSGTVTDDGLPAGSTVTSAWSKQSGPGTVTFANPNSASTTATFSQAGTYVLRLTATDTALSAFDEVTITVNAGNVAPTVGAGPDQAITLPNTAALNGTVTDDGLPAGSTVTSTWTKQSGPGTVTFANPNSASTTATFSQAGTYVLRLTATDTALSAFDEVTITVNAGNVAPTVNAGPDQAITLPNTATLSGTVTDDGLPAGSAVTSTWTKQSGLGTVTFANPNAASTTATFSQAGTYVLRSTATDTVLSAFDEVTITVNAGNVAPTVNAGPDQAVTLPNAATLNGTVTDDGLPAGSTVTSTWSKQSGPGTVTFANPNAASTTATFSQAGTYVVRLTATDTSLSAFDEVTITVSAGTTNKAPTVSAGSNVSVTIPALATLNGSVTDDGLPAGKSLVISWSKVSGPGNVVFETPLAAVTKAGFSVAGAYVLRLTANDSELSASDDVQVAVTGGPPAAPQVSIAAPAEGTAVRGPITVTGTVNSPALSSWVLESVAGTGVRTIGTGTTNVANAALGAFDPTLLLNGQVQLRLRATDTAAQTTTTQISVVVEGNQKVGNFTVSFVDLSVPLAGFPIDIIRTYDSRMQQLGDFGIGWTLAVKSVRVEENRVLGRDWQQVRMGPLQYCISETRPHIVTVTLTDGSVHKFRPVTSPQCQIAPIQSVDISYEPLPGTTSRLVSDAPEAYVRGIGNIELLDLGQIAPIDASFYQLTMPDKRVLSINEGTGLRAVTDANNNKIDFTPNGIIHSSGKSVLFQRDSVGRITRITDPSGNFLTYTYDVRGDLASFTDQAGNTTTYEYNNSHGLTAIRDPRGIEPLRNEYDSSGRLIKTTDPFGKSVTFTHEIGTRQEIITDRRGNLTVHEYDLNGNIVRTTDALGGITRRTYDARDNMLTETDPLGRTKTFTYDAQDNRLTETDALGNTTTYTFNANRLPLTITDPLGRVRTNTYDARGNLTTIRDPLGNVTTYTYDARGNQTSIRDPLGNITRNEYDASGNLLKQTDPLGNITTFTYDANGNRRSETRTRAGQTLVTQYEYDKLNRRTKTIRPDATSTSVTYNAIGKEATNTDALGRVTQYAYDDAGRLIQTTFPDATTEKSSYDAEGREISKTDRGSRRTVFEYDKLGRLTKTTYADGAATLTTYDAAGQIRTQTDPRGNVTAFSYDAAGRRVETRDPLGNVTAFTVDRAGNEVSVRDARGNTTQFQYDDNGRQIRIVRPDATTEVTAYDAAGRVRQKTDEEGRTTTFDYDALGRLTRVTDALGRITGYAYDEIGNRVSQTDAAGRITRFEYDRIGRRTKRTLPLGMSEAMTYDAAGNLASRTDFNGKTTTFSYDQVDRLTRRTPDASFGEPAVVFTYSPAGQRASMTDESGTSSYSYDSRDRLLTKATPQGTLTYTYDPGGNLIAIRSSNANGTSVDYMYDALNRLASVRDHRGAAGQTTYSYDQIGNLRSSLYTNQVQHTYTYNAVNRLSSLSVARGAIALANYSYAISPTGRRMSVQELGARKVDYQYDAVYRLTRETISGSGTAAANGVIGYTHDTVANRLTRTSTVAAVTAQTFTYDANDRLTRDRYDSNGNTTGSEGDVFVYDSSDRLKQKNPGTVSIVYDGDGNRVAKTVAGQTTRYLTDDRNPTGYVQVLEEVSAGNVGRVYTYGLDLISQNVAGTLHYYVYDGHGSVRYLTSPTGTVTDSYDYDAFGEQLRAGATSNVFLFAGEQYDPAVGQYYLRARNYDTETGRFTTQDVVEGNPFDPLSLHKYMYASGDPVNNADFSGYTTVALTQVGAALAINTILINLAYAIFAAAIACTIIYTVTTLLATAGGPQFGGPCSGKGRHGGRLQVQGNDLVRNHGTDTLSWPWNRDTPLPAADALLGLEGLKLQLNAREYNIRDEAFVQAERFIQNARPTGVAPTERSFYNRAVRQRGGDERVDIHVTTGRAFVN